MARYELNSNGALVPIQPFQNIPAYGIFSTLTNREKVCLNTQDINIQNWNYYYDSILNILKDGIETDEIQHGFVSVIFADNYEIDLSVVDTYMNLIMWYMLVATQTPIESKHIFFSKEITQDVIKDYIDKFLIIDNRKKIDNIILNNIIDDTLHRFHDIDQFALFLSNTVNLEDFIDLMKANEEFNSYIHTDLSNTPLEDIIVIGQKYADRMIDIIKDSKQYLGYDHCLTDAFRAGEGINRKQFKEVAVNIGTKPDGQGSVFPVAINKSFLNGGVSNPLDYFIDSSNGRTAQIIKFKNTGQSGAFARLLGLNSMDSFLHPDPNYDCHTNNFIKLTIKSEKHLKIMINMYYREYLNGMEKLIDINDKSLIGKTLYFRSPITCASHARGQGVCYKCYGDLAYSIRNLNGFGVNIGRLATETTSSQMTQKQISAKHVLEADIERVSWVEKFNELFQVEGNVIMISEDLNTKDFKLIINPDTIELENEEDDDLDGSEDNNFFNEFITSFDILQVSTGEIFHISNDKDTKLYITNELNFIIRKKAKAVEGNILIDFSDLVDLAVFVMYIDNNELSKTLKELKDIINKEKNSKNITVDQFAQNIIDTVIDGGLNVSAIHLLIIASNQVRDYDNILERAKWNEHNPQYQILSLSKALTCNPSVTISLSYQKIGQMLYNPLTFKKSGPSFMDLFFMEKPQNIIYNIDPETDNEFHPEPGEIYDPIIFFEDPDKSTSKEEISF